MTVRELVEVLQRINAAHGGEADVTLKDDLTGGLNALKKVEVINVIYRPEVQQPTVVLQS